MFFWIKKELNDRNSFSSVVKLSISELKNKIKEIYNIDIDPRTIRRNINLLKEKFGYDISTYTDNNIGYYIERDPETDFEPGEIRAIIDTFSYSTFMAEGISKEIIKKCKNLQTIYENEKLKNYIIYSSKQKTNNIEVIKNIEDIQNSILHKNKISFEYWKYNICGDKIKKEIVSNPTVSPYAILYDKQFFYMLAIKDGKEEFYHYRLDRMKNLVELDKKIKINKTEKQIEDYVNTYVEIYSGNEVEIKAICHKDLLGELVNNFGKNINIRPINSEQVEINLKANPVGYKFWALRNLEFMTVLEPQSLVNEINNILKEAGEKYGR